MVPYYWLLLVGSSPESLRGPEAATGGNRLPTDRERSTFDGALEEGTPSRVFLFLTSREYIYTAKKMAARKLFDGWILENQQYVLIDQVGYI